MSTLFEPRKIQWDNPDTYVLTNPKTPTSESDHIKNGLTQFAPLVAHFWIATSGSTQTNNAHLKWVALAKSAILASAQAVNTHLESTNKDIWIHPLPDFHVGGLGIWARAHLSGAQVFPLETWNTVEFCKLIEKESGTLSAIVPAQVYDLVQEKVPAPKSLRAVVVGGGALDNDLYLRARELGWPILPSFGLTECASQVATAELSSLQKLTPPQLKVLSHVQVKVSDTGRLALAGNSLLTGYGLFKPESGWKWEDPKMGEWFTSEDFGKVTNGYLEIFGRTSDFIKIGGESVDLTRLERVLKHEQQSITHRLPDFVIFAVPDARLGHTIHAAAAAEPGSENAKWAQTLAERYNVQVMPYERIRDLHFIEQIPRSPLGKIMRADLLGRLNLVSQ